MVEETYKVKTSVGTFHVEKTVGRSYSGKLQAEYLHIGATNKCVMFSWKVDSPEVVELQWLNTLGQHCEVSGIDIKGPKTTHLFHLAVTLLRQYTPVKRIELQDNSKFPCKLPDGTIERPSLKHYYYMFHGKTWYEDRFGAIPDSEDERKRYESAKSHRTDPEFKPKVEAFPFFNRDIESLLAPIYERTKTWKDFLDEVKEIKEYCILTYPWYMQAVRAMRITIPDQWRIDIGDEYPTVEFTRIVGGGGTRKARRLRHRHDYSYYDTPNYSNLLEIDFGPLVRARQRRH
jgi:hypothetical protein